MPVFDHSQFSRRQFLKLAGTASAALLTGVSASRIFADDLFDAERIIVMPTQAGSRIMIPVRHPVIVHDLDYLKIVAPVVNPLDQPNPVKIALYAHKAAVEWVGDNAFPYRLILDLYQSAPPGTVLTFEPRVFKGESEGSTPVSIRLKQGIELTSLDTRSYINTLGPFPVYARNDGRQEWVDNDYLLDSDTVATMLMAILDQFVLRGILSSDRRTSLFDEYQNSEHFREIIPDDMIRAAVTVLDATGRFSFIKSFVLQPGNYARLNWTILPRLQFAGAGSHSIEPGGEPVQIIWFNRLRARLFNLLQLAASLVHEVLHFGDRAGLPEERDNNLIDILIYGYLLNLLHSRFSPLDVTRISPYQGGILYDAHYFASLDNAQRDYFRDLGITLNSGHLGYRGELLYDQVNRVLVPQGFPAGSDADDRNAIHYWQYEVGSAYGSDYRKVYRSNLATPIPSELKADLGKALFGEEGSSRIGDYFSERLILTMFTYQDLLDADAVWNVANVLSACAVEWNTREVPPAQ